ncbi:MAG: hypothetical protein Hyperionvirus20_29 [Hyperionvirus sp.]|uniref:Uncharacterized protein n=1 Tax=Hyperionvirus sp. TaxID=2487770 RepID=A0A3G5ADA3_9VIRU|nr:MAG: hypothetical protein Hyperionvirus20_29 [Hyperionvirus sp.]
MAEHSLSDTEKIEVIDKVIGLIPDIRKRRAFLIENILTVKEGGDQYVLELIDSKGRAYYRDKYRCVFDASYKLVGIWDFMYEAGRYKYYIFGDEKEKIERIRRMHKN